MRVNLAREYSSLLKLGFPVLVTQLSIIMVSFIDTMMVGAYGVNELASAAFVNSVFMIPVVMLIGFSQGMTPLVGALFGQKNIPAIARMFRAGISVNFILSFIFTLGMGILFLFLDHFGQPEELLPVIRPYYLTILVSLMPMAVFFVCQQSSNGITDTATPMWIMLAANVINLVGNYILIFGKLGAPELGLLGAGLSTLASRLFSAIGILCFYRWNHRYREIWQECRKARGLRPERLQIWNTSFPVMIQSGLEVVLWSLGAIVSGWYGKIQLASYQVVNTIAQLGFMTFISFGVATSVRVANYTGEKDREGVRRIARAGLHLNLLLATLASMIFYLFSDQLIHLFNDDPEVITAAVALIPPLILYQYADATQLTFANALRGTSDVRPLMVVALVAYCIVGIPLLFLFGVGMDFHNVGVYYSFSAALAAAALLLWIFFRRAVSRI